MRTKMTQEGEEEEEEATTTQGAEVKIEINSEGNIITGEDTIGRIMMMITLNTEGEGDIEVDIEG
jgi:hypothetical protein